MATSCTSVPLPVALGWKPVKPLTIFSTQSCFSVKFRKTRPLKVYCDYRCFEIRDVSYRPPGTEINILSGVNLSLTEKSFGLIFGRSGSGKTTLLQLIAGLSKPTSGSLYIQRYSDDGNPNRSSELLSPERVGIVFQFPERYFLADTVLDEVTFGWPRQKGDLQLKELLTSRLQRAITSVGLNGISLDKDPKSLSGGYKRRLALAIQLVQTPDLLVLDEPLAGLGSGVSTFMCLIYCSVALPEFCEYVSHTTEIASFDTLELDWRARADVVKLLKRLKEELTILVVSHDLKELVSLVDKSWSMEMGGVLKEESVTV